jgi:hypothetical protein
MSEDNIHRLKTMPEDPRAERARRVSSGERLNGPHEVRVAYVARAAEPGGGTQIFLDSAEQAAEWDRDPDAFAARHLAFPSTTAYREWVALDGIALCGSMTSKGRMCSNQLGRIQLGREEWLALHRNGRCHAHKG